ncbi:uncharacterized protein MCAP_0864-like [Phlebotomus papatasi]|uniref:uncharacterized protein MCAP_0864-like n=1 Tax=Phlebotomus papatasi TaxID=29031 RepID=UPI0024843A53|nr:uncharacterized protein MCAP_0864-like [Phlebotomus papatasi]
MEQSEMADVICDSIRCLETKVDGLQREMRELIQSNKDLKIECSELKVKVDGLMAKQGKVNVQLNLLNKYIEGVKSYFPIENVEKLMELEQKMADNEGIKAAVETQLRRLLKPGDKDFLPKVAKIDVFEDFNVTGRGKRKNILDLNIFKYSAEIMRLNRHEVRLHVERQQSKLRQKKIRAEKSSRMENIENNSPAAEQDQNLNVNERHSEVTSEIPDPFAVEFPEHIALPSKLRRIS